MKEERNVAEKNSVFEKVTDTRACSVTDSVTDDKGSETPSFSAQDKKELRAGVICGIIFMATMAMIAFRETLLPSTHEFFRAMMGGKVVFSQMLVVAFTLASCSSVVYYFMKPLPGAVVTMLAIISMSIDSTPLWTVAMFIVAMLEMYLMIYWMLPPLLPALKEMEFFRREESKSEG
jgi:hypothetical protein